MPGDVLVGIDAGTSVIKAVAFTLEGRQLAVTAEPNAYTSLPDGGVEQDMARTWRETAAVLRRLGEEVSELQRRCAALAVTGQGDGTWLIDKRGEPVAPAWLWLDSRAAALVEARRADGTGACTYRLTGSGLNACQQSAHLLWLKEHRPEALARAATAFHCKDWLYFKLTGERATDPTEGSFTFGDFRRRSYAPEILDALDIPELARLLPPMVDGAATWHPLTAEAGEAVGLPAGTPVVLGSVDVVCTALGGGLYSEGRELGCSVIGSTGMHMRIAHGADDVTLNDACTGYTMVMPAPDTFAQMQSNMAATLNIDWLLDLAVEVATALGANTSRKAALGVVDAQILAARPGVGAAPSVHPHRRRARPVRRPPRPRAVHRPRPRPGLSRPRPRGLRGPRLRRRATATRRWAISPRKCGSPVVLRAARRCAGSSPARSAPRSGPARARRPGRPARR